MFSGRVIICGCCNCGASIGKPVLSAKGNCACDWSVKPFKPLKPNPLKPNPFNIAGARPLTFWNSSCFRLASFDSFSAAWFRKIRLIELTLGTFELSQTPSDKRVFLISHANIHGFSSLSLTILATTFGVATFGLLPPMAPGRTDPVS